jgi:hypothetical protein
MQLRVFEWILNRISDLWLFWEPEDTRRIEAIRRARAGMLEGHDDLMIDSTKNHLLLATKQGFYLVSRNHFWKARLTDEEMSSYERRGSRLFSRFESSHRKTKE